MSKCVQYSKTTLAFINGLSALTFTQTASSPKLISIMHCKFEDVLESGYLDYASIEDLECFLA